MPITTCPLCKVTESGKSVQVGTSFFWVVSNKPPKPVLGIDILIMLETWHDEANGIRADNHYNYWCGPCDNGHHGVGLPVYKEVSVVDFQKYEVGGSFARAAQLTIQLCECLESEHLLLYGRRLLK